MNRWRHSRWRQLEGRERRAGSLRGDKRWGRDEGGVLLGLSRGWGGLWAGLSAVSVASGLHELHGVGEEDMNGDGGGRGGGGR